MAGQIQIDHVNYPKRLKNLSDESLRYIMQDAHKAMMANPYGPKAGYYADEINYCGMELAKRKKENEVMSRIQDMKFTSGDGKKRTLREHNEYVLDMIEKAQQNRTDSTGPK